jgi:hypothetical protein
MKRRLPSIIRASAASGEKVVCVRAGRDASVIGATAASVHANDPAIKPRRGTARLAVGSQALQVQSGAGREPAAGIDKDMVLFPRCACAVNDTVAYPGMVETWIAAIQ